MVQDSPGERMNPAVTAARAGLAECRRCGQLSRLPKPPAARAHCPRCGAVLRVRIRNSVGRTWALVVAAFILYVPANVLPMLTTTQLGHSESNTILGGVKYFIDTGDLLLAAVIFAASIVVPLTKLLVLCYLLISVKRKSRWRPKDRTRLFRMIELIGPWSMLDVFVVALMVALVHAGALANIEAESAALFFAAVVVITMFAAMTFDTRLIWDRMEAEHG